MPPEDPARLVERPSPLTLSKKIFSVLFTAALLALFVLAIRRAPRGILESLEHARPAPLLAGFAVFFASHVLRGARLNRLLPKDERIAAARAFGLSGASHFLVQVVPFRGGDVASLALVHRELGVTWSRSGGVFVLIKLIDTASAVLVGLAGGTVVLLSHRVAGGPWAAGLFCVLLAAPTHPPSAVLVGLAGGTVVLLSHRVAGGPWAAGLFCVLLAALTVLPEAGGALLEAF